MAGFVKSIKQSRYLKCTLLVYMMTLFFLVLHLIKMSTWSNIPQLSDKTLATPVHDINVSQLHENTAIKTESIIPDLNGQDQVPDLNGQDQVRVISRCPITAFSFGRFREETWQKVGPTNATILFSAYHEERNAGRIQIMGLCANRALRHFCQLWYKGNERSTVFMNVTTAAMVMLHSDPRMYISCAINCALPDSRVPVAVSLVSGSDDCAIADNLVKIRNIPKHKEYTRNFTVCVSPLNFRYGRAYELVEWIELNLLLGANHFIVYNYSSAVNVCSVLEHYRQMGIVEVVQWPLTIGVDRWPRTNDPIHVHYFAQTSAFNDCLLRSRYESKYVVVLDLDEFIIPHSNAVTWSDMIGRLQPSGVYMFRNSFFRKEWTDETLDFPEKSEAEKYRLVTLLKVDRESHIWPAKQRTKYIARTSAVEVIVTHDVYRLTPGQGILVVSPDIGLLHHYRNWLKYDDKQARVSDKTVIGKYAKLLVDRVRTTWSMLKDVELDIPIE